MSAVAVFITPEGQSDAKFRAYVEGLERDRDRLNLLERMVATGRIEIAVSLWGTGYEIGHWSKAGPVAVVDPGPLRAAIDAAATRWKYV